MKNALVLVDFQNEWINPESDYFVGDISKVISKVNSLIEFCRKKDYKIIFTRHIEEGSADAFAKGSKSTEIIPKITRQRHDILITKNKISPFYKTTLEKELRGIKHLVVAGILTNLCVRSLVEEAYDRDFEITVIKDCCVAMDKKTQEFTFKDLKNTREEVQFLNLKDFIEK